MIGNGGIDCPFCAVETWDKSLFNTNEAYVLPPLNPVTPGHLLLIPFSHFHTDSEQALHYGGVVAMEVLKAYVRATGLSLDGYNIILNGGVAASQSVEHMHWHFVPRREGDGLMLPWTNQIKES